MAKLLGQNEMTGIVFKHGGKPLYLRRKTVRLRARAQRIIIKCCKSLKQGRWGKENGNYSISRVGKGIEQGWV